MIKVEDLVLSKEELSQGSVFFLVELLPIYSVEPTTHKVTDTRCGTDVVVAMSHCKFEHLVVHLSESIACEAFNHLGIQCVTFRNLEGRFVKNKQTKIYEVRATATSFTLEPWIQPIQRESD